MMGLELHVEKFVDILFPMREYVCTSWRFAIFLGLWSSDDNGKRCIFMYVSMKGTRKKEKIRQKDRKTER